MIRPNQNHTRYRCAIESMLGIIKLARQQFCVRLVNITNIKYQTRY